MVDRKRRIAISPGDGKAGLQKPAGAWDLIWRIGFLRIAAYIIFMALVLLGAFLHVIPAEGMNLFLYIAFIIYFAVYFYGGYRAVSKSGYSAAKAAAISAVIGAFCGSMGQSGDISAYLLPIITEAAVAALAGYIGAVYAERKTASQSAANAPGVILAVVLPIVALRIAALLVFAVIEMVLSGWSMKTLIQFLPVAFIVYAAIYFYGGYKAFSKFGYSDVKAAAAGALIGGISALIICFLYGEADYLFSIFIELIEAAILGYAGARFAQNRMKR